MPELFEPESFIYSYLWCAVHKFFSAFYASGKAGHGLEESRERKHTEVDSVERGYNESFSVGPEFNRAAEFARKAAEESASANAESKEAYKR